MRPGRRHGSCWRWLLLRCVTMVIRRPLEPLLWLLFSAGGVMSALLLPVAGVPVRPGVPARMAVAARATQHLLSVLGHPLDAPGALRALLAVAVPLGPSLPLHALRRPADQAPERDDQLPRAMAGRSWARSRRRIWSGGFRRENSQKDHRRAAATGFGVLPDFCEKLVESLSRQPLPALISWLPPSGGSAGGRSTSIAIRRARTRPRGGWSITLILTSPRSSGAEARRSCIRAGRTLS